MSKRDALWLVSRATSLYLIFWVLVDISYLPAHLFSFVEHFRLETTASAGSHYWREYYQIELVFLVARIFGLSILARWFYKCGPAVSALLLPSEPETAPEAVQD